MRTFPPSEKLKYVKHNFRTMRAWGVNFWYVWMVWCRGDNWMKWMNFSQQLNFPTDGVAFSLLYWCRRSHGRMIIFVHCEERRESCAESQSCKSVFASMNESAVNFLVEGHADSEKNERVERGVQRWGHQQRVLARCTYIIYRLSNVIRLMLIFSIISISSISGLMRFYFKSFYSQENKSKCCSTCVSELMYSKG